MTTSVANLDVTQYVKVNSNRKAITLQSMRDEVRIALSDAKPAVGNTVFHTLNGGDVPLQFPCIDTDIWVLSMSDTSKLVLSETGDVSKSFLTEVAKGNVPGHSVRTIVARNPDVGVANEDIWHGGGQLVYPTAAESWEIVSDNAADTAAGTGARVVLVNTLDDNYLEQTQTVVLDGVTPVALTGTHFRPNGAAVVSSGSTRANEGELVIRVSGGGLARQYVPPGFANSQDSHYTVPANKSVVGLVTIFSFPKNSDGSVGGRLRFFGTNTDLVTGEFPFYQNITRFDIEGQFFVPEKTDFFFAGRGNQPNTVVNTVFVGLVIDNEAI